MSSKTCFKCNINKDLSEYYTHPRMSDGHLNKCKDCTKKDTKLRTDKLINNPDWVESERTRAREKYHRLGYKDVHKPSPEKQRLYARGHREKYPEKYAAKNKTQHIKPLIKGNHLHHWSYNPEHYKDVIELSIKDHNTAHRFMIYDQERMMYRGLDNVLLDTKEKHLNYINSVINQH